eukprot:2762877-Rhodomonas_salina.1
MAGADDLARLSRRGLLETESENCRWIARQGHRAGILAGASAGHRCVLRLLAHVGHACCVARLLTLVALVLTMTVWAPAGIEGRRGRNQPWRGHHSGKKPRERGGAGTARTQRGRGRVRR